MKGAVHSTRRYMEKPVSALEQIGSCKKDETYLRFACGEPLMRGTVLTSMTEIQKRKTL